MTKWIVFSVLWIAGLFVGDMLAASGLGGAGSRLVFFGGMWMIGCIAAKEAIAGYQEAKTRGKTPNVGGEARAPACRGESPRPAC